jgi:hypothetical protein
LRVTRAITASTIGRYTNTGRTKAAAPKSSPAAANSRQSLFCAPMTHSSSATTTSEADRVSVSTRGAWKIDTGSTATSDAATSPTVGVKTLRPSS